MQNIYIDSRFKTGDSKSNTDFRIQLQQPLELKESVKCAVCDVSIPNTWYSIEETNENMYIEII